MLKYQRAYELNALAHMQLSCATAHALIYTQRVESANIFVVSENKKLAGAEFFGISAFDSGGEVCVSF